MGQASGALYDGVSPLYGGTQAGGNDQGTNPGVVYELTHKPGSSHWHQKVIFSFCLPGCGQAVSSGGLTLDASGNIFGAATHGGADSHGTIFELSPASHGTWTETTLYTFCTTAPCADGAYPNGGLLFDGSGNLVGSTFSGGNACANDSDGCGVAFRLTPNGAQSTYSLMYTFCSLSDCADGGNPSGGLLDDGSGNMLGTTLGGGAKDSLGDDLGGGTVFKLSGRGEQVLHSFCQKVDCTDGLEPLAGLARDATGDFFGVTQNGGKNQAGTVFELTP